MFLLKPGSLNVATAVTVTADIVDTGGFPTRAGDVSAASAPAAALPAATAALPAS